MFSHYYYYYFYTKNFIKEKGCMNMYGYISCIIINAYKYLYINIYMFIYVYTYLCIFMHEQFFTKDIIHNYNYINILEESRQYINILLCF